MKNVDLISENSSWNLSFLVKTKTSKSKLMQFSAVSPPYQNEQGSSVFIGHFGKQQDYL